MQTILQNVPSVIALLVAVTLCVALLISFGAAAFGHPLDAATMQIVNSALPVLLAFLGGAGIGGGAMAYRSARANEMLAQTMAQTLGTLSAKEK